MPGVHYLQCAWPRFSLPSISLPPPPNSHHPLVLLPATTTAASLPDPLSGLGGAPAVYPDGSPSEQGWSLVVPHAPHLQHQELCVSQTPALTHPRQALGCFNTPRKPLLPGPPSRDVDTTMVMSCAEELGAGLHDGAGEATALLEQGEACFGHVWCRCLLPPGSHFLLFDRSYGKRNRCLPGDESTGPIAAS